MTLTDCVNDDIKDSLHQELHKHVHTTWQDIVKPLHQWDDKPTFDLYMQDNNKFDNSIFKKIKDQLPEILKDVPDIGKNLTIMCTVYSSHTLMVLQLQLELIVVVCHCPVYLQNLRRMK